jgi:hypothetical protein
MTAFLLVSGPSSPNKICLLRRGEAPQLRPYAPLLRPSMLPSGGTCPLVLSRPHVPRVDVSPLCDRAELLVLIAFRRRYLAKTDETRLRDCRVIKDLPVDRVVGKFSDTVAIYSPQGTSIEGNSFYHYTINLTRDCRVRFG